MWWNMAGIWWNVVEYDWNMVEYSRNMVGHAWNMAEHGDGVAALPIILLCVNWEWMYSSVSKWYVLLSIFCNATD